MNGGALVDRQDLIDLLEATIDELERNASFEGRLQYTCMTDECVNTPTGCREGGKFAVRAFIRTGNDMGQGSSMLIAGDIVMDAPPETVEEAHARGMKDERVRIVKSLRDEVARDKFDPNKPLTELVMAIAKGTLLGFADRIEAGTT